MQNPFKNPAFSMAALTSAINILPNRYGRLEDLNLMPAKPVRQRQIIVEEMNGVLNLLPTLPPAPLNLRCSDADDQIFVDLALAQGARWLITHDRALLKLARRAGGRGLAIVTPTCWEVAAAGSAVAPVRRFSGS